MTIWLLVLAPVLAKAGEFPPAEARPELGAALAQARRVARGLDERKAPLGSFFRKVESTPSARARGITATGRLPRFTADPGRLHPLAPGEPEHLFGPLDRPTVYLGAHSRGLEVDAGLGWQRVYREGRPVFEADGWPRFAFRPFWRVDDSRGNRWGHPPKDSPRNLYFQPGERVTMTLQRLEGGRFRLDIRSETDPGRHFTATFDAAFEDGGRMSFKRVNALDQFREERGRAFGNEGRLAIPTGASVRGAVWESVGVLGPAGALGPVFPLTEERTARGHGGGEAGPGGVFRLSSSGSGERIEIIGARH